MKHFEFGGARIAPGTSQIVELEVSVLANNNRLNMPVHVLHGEAPGPVFFMSGAIHGDEILGVEIIRLVIQALKGIKISGTILAVPIVNSFGFLNHSRYLPDRRDLNRSFPGSDRGSLASLLADLFFVQVVERSQFGIDYHTAALHRRNLPQIRLAPNDKDLMTLAEAFAPPVILTAKLRDGSLRKAAMESGVKVLLYEGGEALRFDEMAIDTAVKGTLRFLKAAGIIADAPGPPPHAASFVSSSSVWLRAPEGGIMHSVRRAGDRVKEGEELGVITSAFGENPVPIIAEDAGMIIGRTNLPIVNRGDALFHIARMKPRLKGVVQSVPDEDEII